VETGKLLHTFDKHPASVQSVAATADGNILATGTFPRDASIRLFDRATYEQLDTFRGHTAAVRGMRVLPDDTTLVSAGGERTLRLWDIPSGSERFIFDGGTCIFHFVDVSPDGRTIAAGGRDGTIRLYRAASREEVEAEPGWSRIAEQ
jgi:WD40 repeat protein